MALKFAFANKKIYELMNVLCEHLMVLRKIKIVRINMGIFSFLKAGISDKSQKYEIADYFLVAKYYCTITLLL